MVRTAAALAHLEDPRARDLWTLGARMFPGDAEIYAGLAQTVSSPELAVKYAVFAEANAARSNRIDTQPYTELRQELEARLTA